MAAGAQTNLIDEARRLQMDSQGFTVFERLFADADMAELAAHLEAEERRKNAELAAQGPEGISRANEITFNSHLAENDPVARAFVRRPELVTIASAFLGPDVDLYWNQTVFKHPEGEKLFPWHQDDQYTEVLPSPYLTLWLALNDATLENGCISVLPGSHREGLREHVWTDLGWTGHPADHPDQGIPVPVPAGSVVCFWSLTMHKSAPNRSQGMRKAYVIQYAPQGLRYKESGEPVPDMIPIVRHGLPAV